jgi:hypothetical protein
MRLCVTVPGIGACPDGNAARGNGVDVGIVIRFGGVGVWIALGVEYSACCVSNEALSATIYLSFCSSSAASPYAHRPAKVLLRFSVGAGSSHRIHFCRCCAEHDL